VRIKNSTIRENGEIIEIELMDLPEGQEDYRFIWLRAEDLPDIAYMAKYL